MKNLLSVLAFLFISCLGYTQQANFTSAQKLFDHPVGGLFEFSFIPVDYNKDGIMDYIGRGGNELLVYIGDGENFDPKQVSSFDAFSKPYDIQDFNGDGWDDIIMEFYILEYNPTQESFEPLMLSDDPQDYRTILAIGDFNSDGLNDVVTTSGAGSSQSDLSVHYYNGESFNKVSIPNASNLGPVEVGDLEGDGDLDIAYINEYQVDSPAILINDGQGNFQLRTVAANQILSNRVLDFEDIDNDGDLDFLVVNINAELVIYENTDNFITAPGKFVVDNAQPISNIVVDVNNDGVKDIVCFNVTPSNFSVSFYFTNNGGLDFSVKQFLTIINTETFFISLNPNYTQNALRTEDVERDGDMDIILNFCVGDEPRVLLFENENLSSSNEIEIKEIQLSPNPTTDYISFSEIPNNADLDNYVIFDISGKLVQSGSIRSIINVSNLNSGFYSIQLRGTSSYFNGNFLIQR